MKNLVLLVASLLLGAWLLVMFGLPIGLDLFRNVKIELPSSAIWSLHFSLFLYGLPVTVLVAVSSLLLARHNRWGWNLSLVVCLICDFILVSWAMPFVVVSQLVGTSVLFNNLGVMMLLAAFVLVQALLVTLWKHRGALTRPTLAR